MTDSGTDILIIGAGVAGLAAGCYAQMNGYRTKIFDMHNLPGGLWVEPGGSVPVVAMSGRNIVQQICSEDRKRFTASAPATGQERFSVQASATRIMVADRS